MNAFLDYLEYVWNQLANIGIVDVLDIAIVALLLFWVIKFMRARRAGKLMLGIVMLFLLLLLSAAFEMRALNFILNSLFSVGLIAIVIVFQPELRSALEKVGGVSDNLKSMVDNDEMKLAIGQICDAAQEFSKNRTGALIVFERNVRLGDVIRTGTTIDAVTTSLLLGNIFYNKAPMHDGAVIIRKGRVHAAGCYLPLSSNNNIVKELGTRHRAAIGMSENSDAIILVVSEETGGISIAVDGDIKRNFTRKTLESYLVNSLMGEEKKNIKNVVTGKIFRRSDSGRDEE
ncbi:MAG: diadenylate cyclase CdaA [Clostridia bacterium]|nr:diadenylate cyclase CdaA [Clostridia bacterium]